MERRHESDGTSRCFSATLLRVVAGAWQQLSNFDRRGMLLLQVGEAYISFPPSLMTLSAVAANMAPILCVAGDSFLY